MLQCDYSARVLVAAARCGRQTAKQMAAILIGIFDTTNISPKLRLCRDVPVGQLKGVLLGDSNRCRTDLRILTSLSCHRNPINFGSGSGRMSEF
jgi:hypothetical protein